MARIELRLAHSYLPNPQRDEDYALLPLELAFEDGGAYSLLGPSGCGKTTLLNIMSGLVTPSEGVVLFDGRDVTAHTPQMRNIAQVFQFPVVYDTMTVYDNLAFPLRNRGMSSQNIQQRVHVVAEMLDLDKLLRRRAAGLSADIQQKISLGRGLVRPDVSAVLFDEPLTVIDPQLKWQLRRKLKEVHSELGLTLIYVTHDQVEALTFADEVMVMSRGRVLQVGSPASLFEEPAHTFVGHFIGSPGMNLLPVQIAGGSVSLGDIHIRIPAGMRTVQGAITLGLRPEYTQLANPDHIGAAPAEVRRVQDLGSHLLLTAEVSGQLVKARLPRDLEPAAPEPGDIVGLQLLCERTRFYQNEELIT
jgi:ABC-type sugar transport systems, ATPase components